MKQFVHFAVGLTMCALVVLALFAGWCVLQVFRLLDRLLEREWFEVMALCAAAFIIVRVIF